MHEDLDLLRAWRLGDRRAGNALFNRHFNAILRFFRNKVDEQVEDLVQRTFVACVESRDRFREDSSFRTYLFGVANNVLRHHYRLRQRDARTVSFETHSIVDLGAGPLTLCEVKREQRLLLEGLRRIPLDCQVVLELFYWERFTGAEIGQILELPENTARSRLRRARRQLKQALQELAKSPLELESTLSDLDAWAESVRGELTSLERGRELTPSPSRAGTG
ncbi:MAG: sigma-70 family RNA polymerase sigma factor [Myxococcales bacterium]|nr:sigma-70 family RNA polymerase sigma factor [Myxococcales bacterium]